MNQFKGSGNDYAPTLGSDRYGNNYVDNPSIVLEYDSFFQMLFLID